MEAWIETRVQDLRNLRRRIRVLYERLQRELTARPEIADQIEPATTALDSTLEKATTVPKVELVPLLRWFSAQMGFFHTVEAYLKLILKPEFVESLRRVVSALSVEESLKIHERLVTQTRDLQKATTKGYKLVPDSVVKQLGSTTLNFNEVDLGLLVALARRASSKVRAELESHLDVARDEILGAPPRSLLTTMRPTELVSLAPPSDGGSGSNVAKMILPDRDNVVRLYQLGLLQNPSLPLEYAAALTLPLADLLGSPLKVVKDQSLEISARSGFTSTQYTDKKATNKVTNEAPSTLRSVAYGEHLFAGIETRMHLPPNPVWGSPTSDAWEFPRFRMDTPQSLRALTRSEPVIDSDLFRREAAVGSLLVIASGRAEGRTPRVEILNNLAALSK